MVYLIVSRPKGRLMKNQNGFKLWLLREKTHRGKFRKLKTVELHLTCLDRLIRNAPGLTISQINAYLLSLRDKGRKGTYLNLFIDTMHLYGRFLKTKRYEKLEYYPVEEFRQETMSDEEIEDFLTLPPPKTIRRYKSGKTREIVYNEKGYKVWTLFFKILAYSGMRPGEVAHLTIDQVDFGRQVYILEADDVKTNRFRYVPIAYSLLSELKEHIKNLKGEHLFPAHSGKSFRQGAVVDDVDWGYNFHQRLKRLGIKRKNLRPNSLRPSFITRMLDEDVNIFKVQKIVGHKQIATTAHYTHLTTKDITKALSKDPLSRKSLPYYDRMKQFRTLVRKSLEDFALTPEEEDEMLRSL